MNPSKFNRIKKQIWQPNLIVLPIPERQSSIKHCVEIGVSFDNNYWFSRNLNLDRTLFPELTASDELQPLLAINKPNTHVQTNWFAKRYSNFTRFFGAEDDDLVLARDAIGISITAKIFWEKNILKFDFYLYELHSNSKPYCSIQNLTAGKYRLRFNYLPVAKIFNLNRKSRPIKTTYQNFYLVKPVETNPNAVEIDGIQFEIVAPESAIVPEKELDIETAVAVGMKITNNTQTAFRFDFYSTLIPQMIKADGQVIRKGFGSHQLRSGTESDYPLAMPGEFITFFPNPKLFWFKKQQLTLKMDIGCGGFYYFHDLQPGEYLIRFVYSKNNHFLKMRDRKSNYIKPLQWLERTIVATPYVKLYLSR